MDRALSVRRALAFALALCGSCAAAHEASPDDATSSAAQAWQPTGAGIEVLPGLRSDHLGASPALRELARGTLLRASLGEQGSLTLRLRGGTLSLVWAVPLSR